jgi:DNA polymerase I
MSKLLPLRSMFIAPKDHYLVEFDLSQAETWIVAYLADEPRMKQSLHHGDIHTDTAAAIYNTPTTEITPIQRYLGKKGNHQLSYGSTHYMLARSINHESDEPPYITISIPESKVIYDGWHEIYLIKDWWDDIQDELSKFNRTLTTPYGRKRTFFQSWGKELFKEAYAYKPQSTVADHTNGAVQKELGIEGGVREIYKRLVTKGTIRLVNQSHDSIIAEVHKSIYTNIIGQVTNLLRRPLVINGEEFTIPVDCKYGDRWGELEKVEIAT